MNIIEKYKGRFKVSLISEATFVPRIRIFDKNRNIEMTIPLKREEITEFNLLGIESIEKLINDKIDYYLYGRIREERELKLNQLLNGSKTQKNRMGESIDSE